MFHRGFFSKSLFSSIALSGYFDISPNFNHLKINQLRDNTFSKRQYPFNLNIKNSSINKMPTNILNYFVIVPLNVSIFLSKFLQ